VVTVVSTVRRQIKSHGHTLLTGRQRLAIKCVGFFGGGKARVLADGPRAACIHRRLHAAGKRRLARDAAYMRQVCGVLGGIDRLHGDAL